MKNKDRPVVIAHRGACGYLPEHTLPAKALAFAMGADFLEQDLVATRDDELVVLHDIHVDRVTNVAERFPGRARADGRYYARDFSLEELRSLSVWERFDDAGRAVFPGRYPTKTGSFSINTLDEELAFARALNESMDREVGVYPEIKRPAWHKSEGIDIAPLLLQKLADAGYTGASDPVYVQCFDAVETRRLRQELDCELRLVQLIADNSWGESSTDFDYLRSGSGLREVATYANGIGPWINHCYESDSAGVQTTGLIEAAGEAGLEVHPYTLRRDALPPGFESVGKLLSFLFETAGADGVFTDFPDDAVGYIRNNGGSGQGT